MIRIWINNYLYAFIIISIYACFPLSCIHWFLPRPLLSFCRVPISDCSETTPEYSSCLYSNLDPLDPHCWQTYPSYAKVGVVRFWQKWELPLNYSLWFIWDSSSFRLIPYFVLMHSSNIYEVLYLRSLVFSA